MYCAVGVQPAVQQDGTGRHLRSKFDRSVRLAVDTPAAAVRQPVPGPAGGRRRRVLSFMAWAGERDLLVARPIIGLKSPEAFPARDDHVVVTLIFTCGLS